METKKNQGRWRPKKDFWELKSKIANEAIQNKWKYWRWRPKKEKKIDDSINTKISKHNKDIDTLEKKNIEIHKNIKSKKLDNNYTWSKNEKHEKYSQVLLRCAIIIFVISVLIFISSKFQSNKLVFSEIKSSPTNENQKIEQEIWHEDLENVVIEVEVPDNNYTVNDEYTDIIKTFYDKINNRDFSSLADITDSYLKKTDTYRTYFSVNRLSNFLDKIAGNKVYVSSIKELPSNKDNVKKYWYTIKYKVDWINHLIEEAREMAIINRNWRKLIWSIMCVTTGCSKMPFFQK